MGINTMADIVRVHGAGRPDQTALIEGSRDQTWRELYERSCRMANFLASVGVGAQDRVAFLDKNGIEHFEVFFGAALLNAVAVDVDQAVHHMRGSARHQQLGAAERHPAERTGGRHYAAAAAG